MNFSAFQEHLVWVSILVLKRLEIICSGFQYWYVKKLDLRPILEVQFGRKEFGYLDIRQWPINWYSVLSGYCNTKYWISGNFEMLWYGFQSWYVKVRFASCFGGSFRPQRFWVPRHKRTTYKFIFRVVIVLEYQILNFRQFRDGLVWVSILVRKRLDLHHVLEVHFGRKWFGYLDTR